MSLLLDALKKAAQDKQKAKDLDKEGIQSPTKGEDEAMDAMNITETPLERPVESFRESSGQEDFEHEGSEHEKLELTLEESEFEGQREAVESEADSIDQGDTGDDPEFTVDPPFELESKGATTSTISDEALQLLIYKTNKEYRRTQKMLWTGLVSAALVLLIAGGFYYYNGMLEEVEALERKHKIAMRSVKEQPDDTRASTLERHVNNSGVTQQPQQSGEKTQPEKSSVKKRTNKASKQNQQKSDRSSKAVFSVQRTEKRDPIGDLLNKAWQAYAEEDYAKASDAYNQVLNREPLNRDAWMGEAAIAVKQGQLERARAAYSRLLKMDPRDEIATAGLANLNKAKPDTLGESRLKFMLKQQPDAAHLHFALGNFYARQAKWPEAQSAYFNAWQGDSKNADYAFNLAVSLDHIGKQEEAVRFYRSCLELSSGRNISFSVQAVNDRLGRVVRK
jgi:Flp pilus assembly protein TadD